MSMIEYIKVDDRSEIGLLDLELYRKERGQNSKRDLEKEGAKFLLEEMHTGISKHLYYDEYGKPHLDECGKFISISHSHDRLAIIMNNKEHTGIDIELIRDKVLNVRHKFLSPGEYSAIRENETEKYLVYWAAKESLYKIHGRKKVDFIRHLFIEPFNYDLGGGELTGKISLTGYKKTFRLHYERRENYILVYMLNEHE
ncbi:MAG: 4'-phosphopantetheinyl transferase family protein [Bacteroidia bacterium]